jgi:hypothetical protein
MAVDIKKKVRPVRSRSYLNKDFDGFRSELLRYARTFFPDRINDFSEASLGGLLLDLASHIGDVNSFYLDHQFNELSVETAVESKNIERHIRAAGVKITGASPAVVDVMFYIEVPAELSGNTYIPKSSALPIIQAGTKIKSNSGIIFELTEDINFTDTDANGDLLANYQLSSKNSNGTPASFILFTNGLCISGASTSQTFSIPNQFVPFRTITLSKENVTEISRVTDSEGNEYYEVDSLTQDVVFKGILNVDEDGTLVKENMEIVPAPYRYISEMSVQTGLTTLRFGSGQASSIDDDIIPDPSELSLPLYGKQTFSRFSIDPGQLLQTQTLGISPVNTTLTVAYRHGGGLSHNVAASTIKSVQTILISFPGNPTNIIASQVRASINILNESPASGGENAPTLDDLKLKVPSARNAQSRIVTREDLLSRVYTMPSNFGRVFRAGVRSNPNNPLATQLFVISRDVNSNLILSPDALKKNLRTYLNQFRLISDAIDILDTRVINMKVSFNIVVDPTANKSSVIQSVISSLRQYFDIKNFQIDQPIMTSDVMNIIINNVGVVSVVDLKFTNLRGTIQEKIYSDASFNVSANTKKGIIIGPPGSIFEIKYPDFDIVGVAS